MMNSLVKSSVLLVFVSMVTACQSNLGASAIRDSYSGNSTAQFSDVIDKDWVLTELRFAKETVTLEQSQYFTLRFDANRVGGTGAPNHYSGPYTLGDNNAITFGLMVSTMMAPLFEPEKLKEQEYYNYLTNTYKWNLIGGKLELYSKDNDGAEVVLVFAL